MFHFSRWYCFKSIRTSFISLSRSYKLEIMRLFFSIYTRTVANNWFLSLSLSLFSRVSLLILVHRDLFVCSGIYKKTIYKIYILEHTWNSINRIQTHTHTHFLFFWLPNWINNKHVNKSLVVTFIDCYHVTIFSYCCCCIQFLVDYLFKDITLSFFSLCNIFLIIYLWWD